MEPVELNMDAKTSYVSAKTIEQDLLHPDASPLWADELAARLDREANGIVFRIGDITDSPTEAKDWALRVMQLMLAALHRRGAPQAMRIEVDEPQTTRVIPGHPHRTLLPHHDSAHSSYLTPSRNDDPTWSPRMRTFANNGITTSETHKMYHGILVHDAGEAASITTFYDKVALLRLAHTRVSRDTRPLVEDVARWAGTHIRRQWPVRGDFKYLTLAAAFGSDIEAARQVPIHWAEADFSEAELSRFPELRVFSNADYESPALGLLDTWMTETFEMSWAEIRRRYERRLISRRYDFILGHNLTNLHGGWRGGSHRILQPICLVVDVPSGPEYESWLARCWREHWKD